MAINWIFLFAGVVSTVLGITQLIGRKKLTKVDAKGWEVILGKSKKNRKDSKPPLYSVIDIRLFGIIYLGLGIYCLWHAFS